MKLLAEKLINNLEIGMAWLTHSTLNHDLASYCAMETGYGLADPYAVVGDDGSLLSVFRLDGAMQMLGSKELERLVQTLDAKFRGYFTDHGHQLNVFFESNPNFTARHLRRLAGPSFRTARRIGLNIDDVLQNQIDVLADTCTFEETLIGIWTTPRAVPPLILKGEQQDKAKEAGTIGKFTLRDAQNPFATIHALHDKHESVFHAVMEDFRSCSLAVTPLSAHEVVAKARTMVDPDVDPLWRPVLPGDKLPFRVPAKEPGSDISHAWYPRLPRQILTRPIQTGRTKSGIETVRVGSTIYTSLMFEMYPQDIYSFSVLLKRIDRKTPWRINYLIEPDGLSHLQVTKFLLSFFGFMGKNKQIRQTLTELEEAAKDGIPNVALRIAVATWAPADNEHQLERNHTVISRAIQGWGPADVTGEVGDPVAGFASTAPFFSRVNIATGAVAPMEDAIHLLPLTRPASPWATGSVLFHTPDGKVFPFEPGSSVETTWIYLMYAPPGSGKSVLLNRIARAFCVRSGLTRLPFVACIDVGPSSQGMIDTIAWGLPAEQRYLTGKFLLRMIRECAINMFDTQPGCRFPTKLERSFMVDLLALLGTPAGESKPLANVGELAGVLVDEVYQHYSDHENGQPKLYEPHRDQKVDAALAEIKYQADEHATWWEVTDALFKHKRYHASGLAQRYAVPILSDLVEVLENKKVLELFAASDHPALVSTGETLIAAMKRILITACREYPILSNETRFDLGGARVFTIDLDPIVGDGPEGEKRTAMCFLLARHLAARNFFLKPNMVSEMHQASPPFYHDYNLKRAKEYFETPKFLLMDELHNAGKSKSEAFQSALERDGRQGRKSNLLLALSSQFAGDFPETLAKMATATFILRSPDPETAGELREKFGLSETVMRYLEMECHGPGPQGAKFVGVFQTKRGRFVQGLVNRLGSLELWSLSTTSDDVKLRDALFAKLGPIEARRRLAAHWPGGSAADEVNERRLELGELSGEADTEQDVIEVMVNEVAAAGK